MKYLVLPLSQMSLFFLGGLSTGLPGVLTWQTMNIWLAQLGYSKSLIGLFFLTGAPYNLKIFLSWAIDRIELPILSPFFGRRRSWAIVLQGLLAISLYILGQSTNHLAIYWTALLCFWISMLSSMNQIATVSHRIEQVYPEESSQSVTSGIIGYRVGRFIGRAGAIGLLAYCSWGTIYTLFAGLMTITMIAYACISDRVDHHAATELPQKESVLPFSLSRLWQEMVLDPFLTFRNDYQDRWLLILMILCSMNLGDALILGMCDLFYYEKGYTDWEIATITKGLALLFSIGGGVLATALTINQERIFQLLKTSAYLHLLAHIGLMILALSPRTLWGLGITIMLEALSGGMRATLLATWVAQLCHHYGLTARQYALFSSLKAIPFFIIASTSGFLADLLSWPLFFLCGLACAMPSMVILIQTSNQFSTIKTVPNEQQKIHAL